VTESLNPLTLPTPADAEEWLDSRARADLDRARELVAGIKADRPADATDLLNRWNDVSVAIGNVASVASLFSEVHPLETVRSRGESAMQEVQKLDTDLSLDRDLYEVFAAVDGSGLDATAKRLLDKTLLDFHRGGVDKDDATRTRVKELSERAITHRWSPVRLLASRLGPDAAVRGAAGVVVKRVLSEPAAVFRASGRHVAPTPP